MDCRAFSRHIGDYVNRTLSGSIAEEAEAHLSVCPQCAALVRELENASDMVRSLHRVSAPAGFEQRLRGRLAACSASETADAGRIRRWLGAVRKAFAGTAVHPRRLALRLVRLGGGLLLCAVIVGSILLIGQGRYDQAETDWGYIETCREQHASFASANPLADESAVILRERARDLGSDL